jgi:hypothetical protein
MIFTPKTEEELQRDGLCPEGIYCYEVIKSEDKISEAGNEYVSITLKVWDNDGHEHLVFTNMSLIKLLKHFCDMNGLQEQYKSGNISSNEFLHKSGGRVVIAIQGEKPNPNGGMYKAKNVVKDYVPREQGSLMKPLPASKDSFIDDNLPF